MAKSDTKQLEILEQISQNAHDTGNPMLARQTEIGEMLRDQDNDLNDSTKLKAVDLLAELVSMDPAHADGTAVRRMAKFFLHGPEENFKIFDPTPMMKSAFSALTGFISEGGNIGDPKQSESEQKEDQNDILDRVIKKAPDYGISGKNVNVLARHVQPVMV